MSEEIAAASVTANTWIAEVTDKGNALLSKLAEGNTLEITRAVAGSGTVDAALIKQQTAVASPQQTVTIQPVAYPEDKKCKLPITIRNNGLTNSYTATNIGVFANDPDEGEILFFMAVADGNGTSIVSEALQPGYSATFDFYVNFGNADGVSVTVDPSNAVTQEGMENYVSTAIVAAQQQPITTGGTGAAYTATVPGITALKAGASFVMIPHVVSTTNQPTLNVNGLGAKAIRQPLTTNTGATTAAALDTWLSGGKPVRVTYDGTLWKTEIPRPSAASLYGAVGIEHGGTDADNRTDALVNLHDVPGAPLRAHMMYVNLAATGLANVSMTTEEVALAMANDTMITWSHTTNTDVYLTDAPASWGVCTLVRGFSENYIHGVFFAYDGEIYRYKYHNTNKTKSGWTRVLSNILSPEDYGDELPDDPGPAGRIFFKRVSS